MMVCSNIVRAKHIQNRMDTFLTSLEDKDEGAEVSIKQTEHLKTLNDELNACEKRISDTISKLNGDRSKRVEKLQSVNANILSLVEAFQEKESRDLMIMMADKLNKLIEEEAGRFESVSEFSARIFGISPDELI
jgi:tRNA U34 5-carboxymethylaminomethyl modifying GTPase MnmE/TrmE